MREERGDGDRLGVDMKIGGRGWWRAYISESGGGPTLALSEPFYTRTHRVGTGTPLLPCVDVAGGERMAVCGIKTHFDHLETANVTGIKNDLGVMDGTDLDTGAGGGLRHGRRRTEEGETEEEGGGEDGGMDKYPSTLCLAIASEATRLRLPLGTWEGRTI